MEELSGPDIQALGELDEWAFDEYSYLIKAIVETLTPPYWQHQRTPLLSSSSTGVDKFD